MKKRPVKKICACGHVAVIYPSVSECARVEHYRHSNILKRISRGLLYDGYRYQYADERKR